MTGLLRRPVARLFWAAHPADLSTTKCIPLSLGLIAERVDRGLYRTPNEWVGDIHAMLSNPFERGKSSFRAAAARQLSHDFDILMSKFSPGLSRPTIELRLAEGQLGSLLARTKSRLRPPVVRGNRPAAEIFKRPCDDPGDIARLASDISSLFSLALIVRVCGWVAAKEPAALIRGSTYFSIQLKSMAQETHERLAAFVIALMEEAAVGSTDPFADKKPALLTQVI